MVSRSYLQLSQHGPVASFTPWNVLLVVYYGLSCGWTLSYRPFIFLCSRTNWISLDFIPLCLYIFLVYWGNSLEQARVVGKLGESSWYFWASLWEESAVVIRTVLPPSCYYTILLQAVRSCIQRCCLDVNLYLLICQHELFHISFRQQTRVFPFFHVCFPCGIFQQWNKIYVRQDLYLGCKSLFLITSHFPQIFHGLTPF